MKRLLSILLATVIIFSLTACEEKTHSGSVNPTESLNEDSMIGEMPSDEYERAIWYGFVDEEMSENRNKTVTWREYCTMIGTMLSFKDEILGAQWQELASLALNSDEEMAVRDQGCFALYRAAELMGEELNDGGIRSVSTNPHLLPSNDGNLPYS